MLTIEKTEVAGLEPALRGMRNALNSWDKSDSFYADAAVDGKGRVVHLDYTIGEADHKLAMSLRKAGSSHRKFMRQIVVWCDITAPLYWHKEMDTYRFGVEKNSCSTMHKIAAKEFTLDDFSAEHLDDGDDYYDMEFLFPGESVSRSEFYPEEALRVVIDSLNEYREMYLGLVQMLKDNKTLSADDRKHLAAKEKYCWWQMIQLLPSSYNQKRTYMFSYEALANMYHDRKNHKLDEWHTFCHWIETLPNADLITGE